MQFMRGRTRFGYKPKPWPHLIYHIPFSTLSFPRVPWLFGRKFQA